MTYLTFVHRVPYAGGHDVSLRTLPVRERPGYILVRRAIPSERPSGRHYI